MAKRRPKDPLLAATNSILLPAVKPFGFQRKSNRMLVRVCEDILHIIHPWYSGWGGRDFYVECFAMPLVPPRTYVYCALGNRLWDDIRRSYSWEGQDHDVVDKSMLRVVQLVREKVMPFFANNASTESFLANLKTDPNPDHHTHFRIGCCLVRLGRLDDAIAHLTAAIHRYVEDGRYWCSDFAAQCEEMLNAIAQSRSLVLLDQWKVETIQNLRLRSIVAASTKRKLDSDIPP